MIQLNALLKRINIAPLETDFTIDAVVFDSRLAGPNTLFVAVEGVNSDGHQFLQEVFSQGCRYAVLQRDILLPEGMVGFTVNDSRAALADLACAFYEDPSSELTLVGVTGTNGKTTTATLLFQLFTRLGYRCGLLSTVRNIIGDRISPSSHTTPDPIALNQLLREMVHEGCQYVFMEVSSHAVHQHRIRSLHFTGAVFTNLTHDHLDYHSTFLDYLNAKKAFFDALVPSSFALSNLDDKNGSVMLQNCKASQHYYALKSVAEFKGKVVENGLTGLVLDINGSVVHSKLIGAFNAYNLLSVYATGKLLGVDSMELLTAISSLEAVQGRFQCFESQSGVTVIVDYAHTPDALENVLKTAGPFRHKNGQLITVIGCGGNRDKGKRPVMAAIAQANSTSVILTSDNPRSENPSDILAEMREGLVPSVQIPVVCIEDREQAILTSSLLAKNPGDIVVIAGKGHESYQEINGVKYPFDDLKIAQKYFNPI